MTTPTPTPQCSASQRLQALRAMEDRPGTVLDAAYWRARSQAAADHLRETTNFDWPGRRVLGFVDDYQLVRER